MIGSQGSGVLCAADAEPNAGSIMLFHPRSKDRPFHLGPFPLETLPRDENVIAVEARRPPIAAIHGLPQRPDDVLTGAVDHYREIFSKFVEGIPAEAKAPVPDDLEPRSVDAARLSEGGGSDARIRPTP